MNTALKIALTMFIILLIGGAYAGVQEITSELTPQEIKFMQSELNRLNMTVDEFMDQTVIEKIHSMDTSVYDPNKEYTIKQACNYIHKNNELHQQAFDALEPIITGHMEG